MLRLACLFVLLITFFPVLIFAIETFEEKAFINVKVRYVNNSDSFILVDQEWSATNSLSFDNSGFYCKPGWWRCSHCERCNQEPYKYCRYCLTPKESTACR